MSATPHSQRHPFVWFQTAVWALLVAMAMLPLLSRQQVPWAEQSLWVAAWATSGVLTSTLMARWLTRLPDVWLRGARLAAAVLGVSTLGSLVWAVMIQLVELGIGRDPMVPPHIDATHYLYMTLGRGVFLLGWWSALFLANELWQRMHLAREQSARALATAHEAQLQLLRSQLNPHFLFNALNSVVALVTENPRGAQTMVRDVSTLLRRSLDADGRHAATLHDELEFVRLYVKCEQVRFEERLQVKFDVADDVNTVRVPPMLLHPLVENAVKHGMHQAEHRALHVEVIARREGNRLHLEVINDGSLTPPTGLLPQGSGVGLKNVKERLATLFPQTHRFDVSERDGRVIAVIELPLETHA